MAATWFLYASYDGGLTATEILSVTARSARHYCDSARGLLIVLWENEGNVQQQRSLDGGATWSTAADVLVGGEPIAGQLLCTDGDERRGNLVMTLDIGGSKSVYESTDLGETFVVKLM